MKAERLILSVVAIVVGLIAAGIAFYLYQMTITVPPSKNQSLTIKSLKTATPTPTPNDENFLTVENPKDESVVDKKTVTISGKTTPKSTIVVSTENDDQVVTPASNGNYTLNEPIGSGTNVIQITSVFPNGEEQKEIRTVTYSTESF
jgi:cytoskeletal protein RodZ